MERRQGTNTQKALRTLKRTFSGTVVIRSDHVVPRTPTFSVQTNELIFSVR
jgi:hypothetical protein